MKLDELSSLSMEAISPEFGRFGIEIINFNIERISIPDEELKKFQEVLGKKMEIEQMIPFKRLPKIMELRVVLWLVVSA